MNQSLRIAWTAFIAVIFLVGNAYAITPAQLRCERAANPLGVDQPQPRLSWILHSPERGVSQSAYQVLAASSPEMLAQDKGDLWDSGQVKSDSNIQIAYAGTPLKSGQQVFWKVRVWDQAGAPSAWSAPAQWTMGLLTDSDWKGAKWIGDPSANSSIGYCSAIAKRPDDLKWVRIDLGRPQRLSGIRLRPIHYAGKDGFGFPVQFIIEASNDSEFQKSTIIVKQTDDLPNPGVKAVSFDSATTARYVRMTATKLPEEKPGEFCFALKQIEVISSQNNIAENRPVTAKDSVEDFGWSKAGLTGGLWQAGTTDSSTHKVFTPNGTTHLRRDFEIKPGLKRALIFVCGLGQQEISLDGRKIGVDLFEPGYTDYRITCYYNTYDITEQLKQNASHQLEVLLGNGFYNIQAAPERYTKFTNSFGPRKCVAMVRFEYANGDMDQLVTDENWKVAPGATTFANMYAGEDYDARLDQAANAIVWSPAAVLPGPGGKLMGASSAAPPVRADEVFKPVSVKEIKPGVSVYDFGQNATMMPRLVANGPAGSSVRMIPSEVVKADGTLDRNTCTESGVRPAWWQYTLTGTGEESFFPKFFWHGSRYLQVELNPATPEGELPAVKSLDACAVMSSSPTAGQFSCSNDLFNKIFSLVRWAQRNNMGSVLCDCPHRERMGWLEQIQLNGPSLRYNFDMNSLFNKIMRDMSDDQTVDGLVPDWIPEYTLLGGAFRDSPEWGSALILVAWQQYEFYGDKQVLNQYYEPMKRYLGYLENKARDNIISGGLGDWCDIGPKAPWFAQLTPVEHTDTCFYFYDAEVMSKIAKVLGKDDDASRFAKLADEIRTTFNQKFFKAETGQYSTGSQAANAIPYAMNIVDAEHRSSVFNGIVEDIKKHGNSFTTGEVAYRYLLRTLADAGRSDLVFTINNQTDKPGYGMQIKKGCTSLTERWDGETTGWSSQSHFMSGQIIEWFYHDLAGIQRDETVPAFKKIIIKPAIVGDITWVKASYDSIQGKIVSQWQRDGQSLALHVSIPANTTATIAVPAADSNSVRESGRPAAQSAGVKFLRMDGAYALCQVGSGEYMFDSTLPAAASN
ncbi:MAG: family 78 glycoside hydrolase catalytic domain [Thermoguttaceae bacterium]